jgi:AraC-like DNA-binding protein
LPAEGNSFGFEEWRSFAAPFFDVIPIGSQDAFRAHATSKRLGRLVVSEVGFDAAIFDRDPGRLKGFDTEFLLLETYDRGTNRGRAGDIATGLETRSVQVFDMAHPWRTQTTEVACRSVVIPYAAIGYDAGQHPAYARLDAGSPRNEMLLAAMGALFDADAQLDPNEAEALGDGFCALVRRLMFNQPDREAEDPKVHDLILRKFIDDRIAQSDLSPQRLCNALGVSRATLYRMLAEDGGVRGYITARRLDRCFDELREGRPKRGRVREVAERWGFFDSKSFNRAFRARFGIAPSDCMDQSGEIEAGSTVAHAMVDWMRRL